MDNKTPTTVDKVGNNYCKCGMPNCQRNMDYKAGYNSRNEEVEELAKELDLLYFVYTHPTHRIALHREERIQELLTKYNKTT